MDQLTAKRYAKALFQIALEKNEIGAYCDQIKAVYDIFGTDESLLKIICHPGLIGSHKMRLLESAFKGRIADDILGFFAVILRKNRESELMGILQAFMDMAWAHNHQVTATITSAVPLSESQIYDIRTKLSQKIDKQVDVVSEIDPSLIAGLTIRVDGRFIDASVKRQLDNMKKSMLQAQLV